jgi:hypothetical protein
MLLDTGSSWSDLANAEFLVGMAVILAIWSVTFVITKFGMDMLVQRALAWAIVASLPAQVIWGIAIGWGHPAAMVYFVTAMLVSFVPVALWLFGVAAKFEAEARQQPPGSSQAIQRDGALRWDLRRRRRT